MSHPTWVRGLKPFLGLSSKELYFVAPYVGAWIETMKQLQLQVDTMVAPYVGAWIETTKEVQDALKESVAPYVGAWIETA